VTPEQHAFWLGVLANALGSVFGGAVVAMGIITLERLTRKRQDKRQRSIATAVVQVELNSILRLLDRYCAADSWAGMSHFDLSILRTLPVLSDLDVPENPERFGQLSAFKQRLEAVNDHLSSIQSGTKTAGLPFDEEVQQLEALKGQIRAELIELRQPCLSLIDQFKLSRGRIGRPVWPAARDRITLLANHTPS